VQKHKDKEDTKRQKST